MEKSLQSLGFKEGQSGYSKHTYFFRLFALFGNGSSLFHAYCGK